MYIVKKKNYKCAFPKLKKKNTTNSTPGWPDSSTGRALHRHRRGQGSNPRSGLNFSGLTAA